MDTDRGESAHELDVRRCQPCQRGKRSSGITRSTVFDGAGISHVARKIEPPATTIKARTIRAPSKRDIIPVEDEPE